MIKLPISAIVVGYNEGAYLKGCLTSIKFCDEIIYFDLGSKDNSIQVAKKYATTIIEHEKVLAIEWIHAAYADNTRYEWVLITDPDEIIDNNLSNEIIGLVKNNEIDNKVGAIRVPILYYFKKKELRGTPWGGDNKRILLINNKRFTFSAQVHVGRNVKEGFKYMDIEYKKGNVIHHYWMQGYRKLLEKHLRYLKNEGSARYNQGNRTSILNIVREPFSQFRYSFIRRKGYKDGLTGLFLSLFWSWYQTYAQIKLYNYQKNAKPLV